ncbi:efflux RND transporter periplasmic adaptor subunit [Ectothiorhodospiraceae bacterium 2226]|nr:efflux RND transporter periplasmic adaptor subunit [Ectothiorhodospiraceae bacterium 2226]
MRARSMVEARRVALVTFAALALLWGSVPLAAEQAATLHWAARVELGLPVSGTVRAVEVREGERVKRGQVLVRLDARGYEAAVARAKARMASQEEALAEAEREAERAEELYERTVLSDHELHVAKIAFARAKAEYAAAQAELVQSELNLEYSVLRAPFDAVVLRRMVEPGQAIASGLQVTPLLVLAQDGRMVARAQAGEEVVGRLTRGAQVPVRVAGQRFDGQVRHVGLEPAEAGGYAVDVEFDYDPNRVTLRAGQSGQVDLP